MELLCTQFHVVDIICDDLEVYRGMASMRWFRALQLELGRSIEWWQIKFKYRCYRIDDTGEITTANWSDRVDQTINPKWSFVDEGVRGGQSILLNAVGLKSRNVRDKSEFIGYINGKFVGYIIVRELDGVTRVYHCSGAEHLYVVDTKIPKYGLVSHYTTMEHDKFLGLIVTATCVMRFDNIMITMVNHKSQYANMPSISLIWYKKMDCTFAIGVLIDPVDDTRVRWMLYAHGYAEIVDGSWPAFYALAAYRYPALAPEIMRFRHELIFLLCDQPRLASIATIYDDWMEPNIVLPVDAEAFWGKR